MFHDSKIISIILKLPKDEYNTVLLSFPLDTYLWYIFSFFPDSTIRYNIEYSV